MEGTSSFLDLRCKNKLDFWIKNYHWKFKKIPKKNWNLEKKSKKFKLRLKEGVSFFPFKFIQYYDIYTYIYIYIYAWLDIGHTSYTLKIILHMCHKHIRTWILYMHLGSGSGYIYIYLYATKFQYKKLCGFKFQVSTPIM
jgi:hypothetical protein